MAYQHRGLPGTVKFVLFSDNLGLVEPRGFEPLTSAVRLRRSPN
jgi:hypothetical protein